MNINLQNSCWSDLVTLYSICIAHQPGTMSAALGILSKHGNNICAVESFPDRESLRRYASFSQHVWIFVNGVYQCRCFVWIEVEGHIKDASLIASVAELRHFTASVHILGTLSMQYSVEPRDVKS